MDRIYDINFTKQELELLHIVLQPRQESTRELAYYAIGKGVKQSDVFEATEHLRDKIRSILRLINKTIK